MLYDKIMDLALRFGDAIVREAMMTPISQLEDMSRDGSPLWTVLYVPRARRGGGLVGGVGSAVPTSPRVRAPTKAKAKHKHKPEARPAKKVVAASKPKPVPVAPEAKPVLAKPTSDDVVLKHVPKDKPVRSDKLKTRTGLTTKVFASRLEDLVRRGVVVRSTQGTHRYYALS